MNETFYFWAPFSGSLSCIFIMDLKGKVVVITGASGAIGAAAARAFDREGSRVVMASRKTSAMEETARSLRDPLVLAVDLSDEDQARNMILQTVDHFGRLDILVNNAASIIVDHSGNVTLGDLLYAFRTNLTGPVAATKEAIRHMRKQGGGHIINVGSPGFLMGIPFYAPYVCSKAAFSAWTRTIQAEWAGTNIRVSEYFPGYILTGSKPESRLGPVSQDFLMAEEQKWITRLFTRPRTPDHVARQLVSLARKPKILVYSSFSTRLGAWLSNIPSFRLAIAGQMAENARKKLNPRDTQ